MDSGKVEWRQINNRVREIVKIESFFIVVTLTYLLLGNLFVMYQPGYMKLFTKVNNQVPT